jgi:hypothetical protein
MNTGRLSKDNINRMENEIPCKEMADVYLSA